MFLHQCLTANYVYRKSEKRIMEHRKKLGLTQEALAEKGDVTTQFVSYAESGKRAMRPENLLKISSALEVSADYLLTGDIIDKDNNAAEQSIRGFCIGKKNWVMIDTIAGTESSAIIYSLAETAKANNLKPYDYFKYLLTEIPKHLDDKNDDFCESLLPWSENLPADCRKKQ